MPLDSVQAKAVYMKQSTMAVDLVMAEEDEEDKDALLLAAAACGWYGCQVWLAPLLLLPKGAATGVPMLTSSLMRCTINTRAMPSMPTKHAADHVETYIWRSVLLIENFPCA